MGYPQVDNTEAMAQARVECLGCGHVRLAGDTEHALGTGACPRCGYVGWAYSSELSEEERRIMREIPVELRPLDSPLARLAWR
jgi:hypothetical protein